MKATHKIIAWLAGAVLLMTLGVSVSYWAFLQIEKAASVRQQSNAVLNRANDLMSALKDAETGERGYLLSGDEAFLKPYLAVRDTITDRLHALQQLTQLGPARQHLNTVAPLVDTKLAHMANAIELRRTQGVTAAVDLIRRGQGLRTMDAIRIEMNQFIQLEQDVLAQREVAFHARMRQLFTIIILTSLLTLLFALTFAWLFYRESQQRLKNRVLLETQHLLEQQEAMNIQLQQVNLGLQISEEKLAVTLHSIGDAVIATDAEARVTLLNPLAEKLTGWTLAQARGRPVSEIFHIINKETRLPGIIPIIETLAQGSVKGMANHTVLRAVDGSECDIADSCAPIRDRNGQVVGAVLVFTDVTRDYAVQRALRDSTAQIQTMLNTVADGIITLQARGGIIETINPAAERMFGYTAAELIGQNFSLLIPELNQDQRNGSLEYYSASDEARASGLGREVVGRRKDDSRFPMEIAASEMWLGGQRYFTGILRDISVRKQAEAALLKAGALQNAIFNSANFSSIATDANGVIQIFNVGAERMLGYDAADVMNKITPADISDPQEVIARAATLSIELGTPIAPGFEALVFKASRGIEDIYELTYIRKDGSRFPAVVSVTALRDDQDAIIGYLLIGTDNTARKQVEAERTQLYITLQKNNTELKNARAVAEKANLAKSNFLSSMSHELRTPLNAILGFAQLLESGSPPPTAAQIVRLHQILKAGWYLLELINEILDLAIIESGKLSLSREPVLLIDVMHECQALIESQALNHGIHITFLPFDHSWVAHADRTRVKQVLINLLSNAIKYNRIQGTVEVACTASTAERIRISIRDSGRGLPPEKLAQLFQPFNRLGQESGTEEGTGIGLVLTKRLVELMGGSIGVESTVGVGSEFWIELIRDLTPAVTGSTLVAELAPLVPGHTAVSTLLYVEDNPANLMLVEQIIESQPRLRMFSARDGNQGITLARTQLPDVILMDINLPGISGLETMTILRNDPLTAHIPVIAITANAIPGDIMKGLEAGFFCYLTKPIKVHELINALSAALAPAEEKLDETLNPGHT